MNKNIMSNKKPKYQDTSEAYRSRYRVMIHALRLVEKDISILVTDKEDVEYISERVQTLKNLVTSRDKHYLSNEVLSSISVLIDAYNTVRYGPESPLLESNLESDGKRFIHLEVANELRRLRRQVI